MTKNSPKTYQLSFYSVQYIWAHWFCLWHWWQLWHHITAALFPISSREPRCLVSAGINGAGRLWIFCLKSERGVRTLTSYRIIRHCSAWHYIEFQYYFSFLFALILSRNLKNNCSIKLYCFCFFIRTVHHPSTSSNKQCCMSLFAVRQTGVLLYNHWLYYKWLMLERKDGIGGEETSFSSCAVAG